MGTEERDVSKIDFRHLTDEEASSLLDLANSSRPKCMHCAYWEEFDSPSLKQFSKDGKVLHDTGTIDYAGFCHRFPPTIWSDETESYLHPTTEHYHWCGELKLRKTL